MKRLLQPLGICLHAWTGCAAETAAETRCADSAARGCRCDVCTACAASKGIFPAGSKTAITTHLATPSPLRLCRLGLCAVHTGQHAPVLSTYTRLDIIAGPGPQALHAPMRTPTAEAARCGAGLKLLTAHSSACSRPQLHMPHALQSGWMDKCQNHGF